MDFSFPFPSCITAVAHLGHRFTSFAIFALKRRSIDQRTSAYAYTLHMKSDPFILSPQYLKFVFTNRIKKKKRLTDFKNRKYEL